VVIEDDLRVRESRGRRVMTGIGLVAVLIVCAWFALGIRQAHDTAQATALLSRTPLSATQAAHIASLLHTAEQLNPDVQVDILRGQLAHDRGRRRQAAQILASVVRREPENAFAWFWKAITATNASEFKLALAHIALLMPKVPAAP
jgi:hypothetical protein